MPIQYPAQVIELLRQLAKHSGPVPVSSNPDAVAVAQADGLVRVLRGWTINTEARKEQPTGKVAVMLTVAGRKALAEFGLRGSEPATDLYYPAIHYNKYGISPETLRKTANKGIVAWRKGTGNRNEYRDVDVRRRWPHLFQP